MSALQWLLVVAVCGVVLYAAFVLALVLAGRHETARGLAGFIPDCFVLVKRLVADPRVPRRRKLVLWLVAGYLAFPIDLVPDFIPVAGQLDDAVVIALGLRALLKGSSTELLREHWPGPQTSLAVVLRLAGAQDRPAPSPAPRERPGTR
jgi:uncharacterized membrane protein YkvA (DUF1232 family)